MLLTGDTIRVKLPKIGAVFRVTVRRVWVALSEAYPMHELFVRVLKKLRDLPVAPPAATATG